MPDTPVLTTDRLVLRGHEAFDHEALHGVWSDREVTRHITGSPSTEAESWGRLLKYAGHWRLAGYGFWAVEHRQTGRYLGEVGLADHRRGLGPAFDGKPEAGWILAPHAQGHGYAREAMRAVLDWADGVLGAPVTVCVVSAAHPVSIRLAQDIGYRAFGATEKAGQEVRLFERPRGRE
ncbi:MAG: GNAT family N-acetyltransferase [Roseovarius sp.]|uniref:GNAT family N-acetyltransferase n=1 Tax=Roseovarius sp. TaxID=1486281 RepID=UPI0032EE07CE